MAGIMVDYSRPSMNGAFRGRGRHYETLLRCPVDGGTLVPAAAGGLRCTAADEHHFSLEDGILRLVDARQQAALEAQSAAREAHGQAQGWHSPDEEAFKSLPQTGLPGYPDGYWERQAEATALLWRFLEVIRRRSGVLPVGPAGEAAVVGAGLGWLAYALDVAGFTTIALDAYAGAQHGLGVYPIARYCRVQADPVTPPLARAAFDLLVYPDGLARDAADYAAALTGAAEALRPGGWLAVMAPLAPERLAPQQTLVEEAGFELLDPPQRGSLRARLLDLRDRVAGRGDSVPPVFLAQKPDRESSAAG